MRKHIIFHIKARCTTIEDVLEAISIIKKARPNAEIDVEVEV